MCREFKNLYVRQNIGRRTGKNHMNSVNVFEQVYVPIGVKILTKKLKTFEIFLILSTL